MSSADGTILALTGGVGGAKLVLGLSDELEATQLQVVVNTGDDFEHLGLPICPDIDTLLYTLAGLANPELGWGIDGETWHALDALERLGGESWFRLGDRDLGTHLWRREQLAGGQSLSQVTRELAARLGVELAVHPMTDDPVRTTVLTEQGELAFQHYFVREQCRPAVNGFRFEGISAARPTRDVVNLLQSEGLSRVVICPSNPYVSVDPILQVPGLWLALRDSQADVVLVSPIVSGRALKGPAAKMMEELGIPVTATGVAEHYQNRYPGLVDHFVIDESDATLVPDIAEIGLATAVTSTVMHTREDKQQLARFCIGLESG
jgi:LPPG:FO 2-phospho-L-lactate transferase